VAPVRFTVKVFVPVTRYDDGNDCVILSPLQSPTAPLISPAFRLFSVAGNARCVQDADLF
jgi:hypothetical protein